MKKADHDKIFLQIEQRMPPDGESTRLFHGPGGFFPGLEDVVIDAYGALAVITLYSPCDENWLNALVTGLQHRAEGRFDNVLVHYRNGPQTVQRMIAGVLPTEAQVQEEGLTYRLRLHPAAQNLGFFGDMRQQRQRVRQHAAGKRVLNLFAYTCSFSVAAVAGGACQVVNLDMNRGALNVGRQNHRDNGLDLRPVSFLAHNVFKSWGKLRRLGPFDLIILDPPAAQGASFTAEKDWPRLLRASAGLLAPQGKMFAALNAPYLGRQWFREQLATHAATLTLIDEPEPPEAFKAVDPDRGLKLAWLQA